jgi:hypothetical protein
MKVNNIKYIILALSGIFMGSCSSDFLEHDPTEFVDESYATSSTDNLFASLNGIHRSLYQRYNSQGEGGLGGFMIMNDALGDDVVMTSAGNGWYNSTYQWLSHTNVNSADDLYPYRVYFRIIRNANVLINGADGAVGSQVEKDIVKGQALVYRAFCHFQLVQLYGKRYVKGVDNNQLGVPVMLKATLEKFPRSTVEQVYTQIHKDLDQAIVLLNGYGRPFKSHFNQNVAQGLKARVALVQGDWATAAQMASLARVGYPLMSVTEYQSGFNDYKNSEWMWGSHVQEDQSEFFANFGAYMSRNYSSTNIRTNPKAINRLLYNLIPATDVRSTIFDPTGKHLSLPTGYTLPSNFSKRLYTSQKFLAVGEGDSRMDVPYMRAAEMFLIEAEAKAQLGAPDAAQVLFDLVSKRNPSYVLSINTAQTLVNEVLLQRRIELWGEGFRFYDLKRTNSALDRTGSNHTNTLTSGLLSVPAGDKRWQWLIPQAEINANPLIEQNEL